MSNMNDIPAEATLAPELKAVGWAITIGSSIFLFTQRPVSIDDTRLDQLVALRDAHEALSRREAQTAAWRETAEQAHRNAEFYRGLVKRCGEAIGQEAYICDDGSVSTSVLALKVPELVEVAFKPRNRFLRALGVILTGK